MMLLIDVSNMAYRALYTLDLSNEGSDVSVVYGVLRILASLIRKHNPRSIAACFDGGTPPYRRKLVPEYKTNRKKDDESGIDWAAVYTQIDDLSDYVLPMHGIMC